MEHFTYLGSVISSDATVSKDLDNRLSKASSSFARLSKRVWQSHSLRLFTKIQVYRAVVIPTLLYGAENWGLYRKQMRLLERFPQRCLRSILGIKWQDYVSDEEVRKKAACQAWIPSCFRCRCAWLGTSQGRKTHACPNQSSSASSKTESVIVELQEALQRPAEKTACTGGHQPSVMAAGGLRPRRLALSCQKSQLRVRGREA